MGAGFVNVESTIIVKMVQKNVASKLNQPNVIVGIVKIKMKINNKRFKEDFNNPKIVNRDLLKKYNFNSIKEMCEYATKNDLVITNSLTEEEKNNINELSKFLKGIVKK